MGIAGKPPVTVSIAVPLLPLLDVAVITAGPPSMPVTRLAESTVANIILDVDHAGGGALSTSLAFCIGLYRGQPDGVTSDDAEDCGNHHDRVDFLRYGQGDRPIKTPEVVAVTDADPLATAVTRPDELTVMTESSEETQENNLPESTPFDESRA